MSWVKLTGGNNQSISHTKALERLMYCTLSRQIPRERGGGGVPFWGNPKLREEEENVVHVPQFSNRLLPPFQNMLF